MASAADSKAVAALVGLCHAALKRAPVDTTDSWLRGAGRDRVEAVLTMLKDNRTINEHFTNGMLLHDATGHGGVGMSPAASWIAGFVRVALGMPEKEWPCIAERFRSLLAMDHNTAPFIVSTTVIGVLLVNTEVLALGDAKLRLAPYEPDKHINRRGGPLPAVVFEYETEIPAAIAPAGSVKFPDVIVKEAQLAHEEAMTRLLLALAFATDGPVQTDVTMYQCTFASVSAGARVEEPGVVVLGYPTALHARATERLEREYAAVADVPVGNIGVATRRYLLARSERVRPADQVLDYAIAIESMTSEWGGKKQGKELARIVSTSDSERKQIEDEHKAFRAARERIVHEGETPANAKEMAAVGASLVHRSLRAQVALASLR